MPILIGGSNPVVRDFAIMLSLVCPCPAQQTLLVAAKVGGVFGCAACGHRWRVDALGLDADTQHLGLVLSQVAATRQKD